MVWEKGTQKRITTFKYKMFRAVQTLAIKKVQSLLFCYIGD